MMHKELLTKKEIANIGEDIGQELGAQMINSYREAHPADVVAWNIGRKIIDQILAQPGCEGIRFYNAINEQGQKTLVYIGIDAAGKEILERVVVEEDGALNKVPAIVADRGEPDWWTTIIKIVTGK